MVEIIEILKTFVDTIVSVINFILGSISQLFILFMNIPTYLTFIMEFVEILPPFVIPFITATIFILVTQYMINRRAD